MKTALLAGFLWSFEVGMVVAGLFLASLENWMAAVLIGFAVFGLFSVARCFNTIVEQLPWGDEA